MYKSFNLTIKTCNVSNFMISNDFDLECPSNYIYNAIEHYRYKNSSHFDTIIKASIFIDIIKNYNDGYLPDAIHIIIDQLEKLNSDNDLWIMLD